VNQSRKQQILAVSLLKELGLDYVRLEPECDGHYRYLAWNAPKLQSNFSDLISLCWGQIWTRPSASSWYKPQIRRYLCTPD
jgi:hypothetical protein